MEETQRPGRKRLRILDRVSILNLRGTMNLLRGRRFRMGRHLPPFLGAMKNVAENLGTNSPSHSTTACLARRSASSFSRIVLREKSWGMGVDL